MSHSNNGLQPQFIRYDASDDADTPNQSLALSANGPWGGGGGGEVRRGETHEICTATFDCDLFYDLLLQAGYRGLSPCLRPRSATT